jgi:hypothetical protein
MLVRLFHPRMERFGWLLWKQSWNAGTHKMVNILTGRGAAKLSVSLTHAGFLCNQSTNQSPSSATVYPRNPTFMYQQLCLLQKQYYESLSLQWTLSLLRCTEVSGCEWLWVAVRVCAVFHRNLKSATHFADSSKPHFYENISKSYIYIYIFNLFRERERETWRNNKRNFVILHSRKRRRNYSCGTIPKKVT